MTEFTTSCNLFREIRVFFFFVAKSTSTKIRFSFFLGRRESVYGWNPWPQMSACSIDMSGLEVRSSDPLRPTHRRQWMNEWARTARRSFLQPTSDSPWHPSPCASPDAASDFDLIKTRAQLLIPASFTLFAIKHFSWNGICQPCYCSSIH